MCTKKNIEVAILGRKYVLAVDEHEELVRELAAFVDSSIRSSKANGASELSAAVLATLQFGLKAAHAEAALAQQTKRLSELLALL